MDPAPRIRRGRLLVSSAFTLLLLQETVSAELATGLAKQAFNAMVFLCSIEMIKLFVSLGIWCGELCREWCSVSFDRAIPNETHENSFRAGLRGGGGLAARIMLRRSGFRGFQIGFKGCTQVAVRHEQAPGLGRLHRSEHCPRGEFSSAHLHCKSTSAFEWFFRPASGSKEFVGNTVATSAARSG